VLSILSESINGLKALKEGTEVIEKYKNISEPERKSLQDGLDM
jgi:hypothetical protein